ncbi:unnamed protein product [Paramecium sonneborni]|uniref:BRCT domain-containing protein n=1 Tax=Paramecium sonneborni TaxID=65129 RepID=A0A8S1M3Z8_9CILI|nr:unnamed protein product [Paramecium sonneborni]
MFFTQKAVKFVILPYKNALPIKFNLQIGANMVGNTQEHEVCINNKQIVNNHCCVVLNEDEIELIVLDGPVYYKNADGDFEQLAKDSVLSLNIESADFLIRLGQTIEAKIQVIDGIQQPSAPKQQPQKEQQIREPQKDYQQFNLQDRLSTIEVKVVESLYTSPQCELQYFKFIQDQEQNNNELNQDDDINSVSFNQEQSNNQQSNKENDQKINHKLTKQNQSNHKSDLQQFNDIEQQTETLSHGTPDFNKNSKDKKAGENKTKQKKKQSTLDYLIMPQRKDRESSPKKKSHHKLSKDIKKESNRMSQRKCSRWKFNIAFSGFHPSREEQQFLLIQNIQICLEDYTFNMLIMEDNVQLRSIKLLIALAKGIPIISRDWLTRSINQYEILDHNQYFVKFSSEFCKEYNFDFKQYQKRLQKCKQDKIQPLDDITIFVPKKMVYHIEHFELEFLIETLGGKFVHQVHDENTKIYMLIPKDQTKIVGYDQYQQSPIECLFKSALKYKNLL